MQFLGSILKNYEQTGGANDNFTRSQSYLEESFLSGATTCLICISKVKRNDSVSMWNIIYFNLQCLFAFARFLNESQFLLVFYI